MVPVAATATGDATASQAEKSEYIVLLKQPAKVAQLGGLDTQAGKATSRAHTGATVQRLEGLGFQAKDTYRTLGGFSAELSAEQVARLQNDPAVASIGKNAKGRIAATQQDPASWGLDRIDQTDLPLDKSFTYPNKGEGVNVFVVDTGIRSTHLDFAGRVGKGVDLVQDGQGTEDCQGHGTHVAGTVAGNQLGVAKGATVTPVRIMGCDGTFRSGTLLEAIDWMIANKQGPSVANMSIGGSGKLPVMDEAIARLEGAGVFTAIAAGNFDNDACEFWPAHATAGTTVAASDQNDARSIWTPGDQESGWGPCVDLFAPGTDIVSASHQGDDRVVAFSGTSMATPHVAGAAAMYLSKNPNAAPAEVKKAILDSAAVDKISDIKGSPNLLLNVQDLVADEPAPDPDPEPTRDFTRVWGKDRYGTAAETAKLWGSSDTVFIASGQGFADATSAGAIAAAQSFGKRAASMPDKGEDSPILLTRQDRVPAVTSEALKALGAKKVVLVGGEGAISAQVANTFAGQGLAVERIDGDDRYETSANVATKFTPGMDVLYIASGEDKAYADALSGSALAGSQDVPVLLANPNGLDASTTAALKALKPKAIHVLGGEAALPKNVADAAAAAAGGASSQRTAGADRYATSVEIAKLFGDHDSMMFASGMNYPDALVGGAFAAHEDSPLLLTRNNKVTGSVAEYVKANPADHNFLFGGTAAVAASVETELKALLGIK